MLAGASAALYWTVWLSSNDMILTKLQFNLIYSTFQGNLLALLLIPAIKVWRRQGTLQGNLLAKSTVMQIFPTLDEDFLIGLRLT